MRRQKRAQNHPAILILFVQLFGRCAILAEVRKTTARLLVHRK
jgi:hypothetical protein